MPSAAEKEDDYNSLSRAFSAQGKEIARLRAMYQAAIAVVHWYDVNSNAQPPDEMRLQIMRARALDGDNQKQPK